MKVEELRDEINDMVNFVTIGVQVCGFFLRLVRLGERVCMLDSVHIIWNKEMLLDTFRRGRSEIRRNDFIFFCLLSPQKVYKSYPCTV